MVTKIRLQNGSFEMIGLRIENTNKFVVIPNIDYDLLKSYLNSFRGEIPKFKNHGGQYSLFVRVNKSGLNIKGDLDKRNVELSFKTEISESDLMNLGVNLFIYSDINERLGELDKDVSFNYAQQASFQKMVKRLAPLAHVDANKYLRKLSAYLDVFFINFYEMKEITDTHFNVELIRKNVISSNLLLGNDVKSEIYEMQPY